MTNRERLALADRVQKNIQKTFVQFQIIRRKERIEKEYKRDSDTLENWLKFSVLSDFFITFMNFLESLRGELDKFFGQAFGDNLIRMKFFDKFVVIGFDFIIGRFGIAV